ncbi:MAG: hypothetical protein ACREJC_15080, partial [Tepidisphaeraceae bacterium]
MTSRTRFSAVAILVCALCAMQANAQPAATTQSADPMLQKVLGMAPVLINSDRTITEFAADGWIDTPRAGRLRFRIGYAAPNRCSLIVYHDFDDTPLLFYADGKGWVYDGRNSQAILLTRAQGLFSVGIVGGQHVFEMAMTSFKPGREPHDVLNVDIKSLFSGAAVQIAQTGEYTYSLR